MAILTQGTEIYVLAPSKAQPTTLEVLKIVNPTTFDPGADTTDEIETTPLDEREAREYMPGLETPAEASLGINADPNVASHVRLYELRKAPLKWTLGWSDGTAAPALNTAGDGFELPPSRTWFTFEGYISSFPFSFETNSVVASTITIRRSGKAAWTPKVGA